MSLLLMLVILCLFIPSSQALKCYACTSLYSSDCRDPFVSSSTCNFGNICKKVKYEVNGEQMICLLSFRFGKMHLFLLTNCSFQVQPKQGRPQEFASWGSQIEGVSKQSKSRDNNGKGFSEAEVPNSSLSAPVNKTWNVSLLLSSNSIHICTDIVTRA